MRNRQDVFSSWCAIPGDMRFTQLEWNGTWSRSIFLRRRLRTQAEPAHELGLGNNIKAVRSAECLLSENLGCSTISIACVRIWLGVG
jgi:hypothetical protein